MNKIPSSLLTMLALLLGAGVAIQTVRVKDQKDQAAAASSALEARSKQTEQLEADIQHLEDQRRESKREVDNLRHELAAVRTERASSEPVSAPNASQAAATPAAIDQKASPMGEMVAKMLEDPEMRQFIRNQQRQMMDPLYEPLIQRLGLTPEEGDVLKDYLVDTQMSAANQVGALFGGSATNRADAMATLSADQKRADETLRVFLGEEGYTQYKEYQETLGERMQLNQFKMQLGGKQPITDEQTEWLLALMREEKRAAANVTGQAFPGAGQDPANMQAMLSGENAEHILQMQETVNQRVYERAREGLDPDQLEAFRRFQTNQLQTMRMGMSMMLRVVTPAAEGGTATP